MYGFNINFPLIIHFLLNYIVGENIDCVISMFGNLLKFFPFSCYSSDSILAICITEIVLFWACLLITL